MVLTYNTVDKIDIQVANGTSIGYFGTEDDLSTIPKQIGDWYLKTVPDDYRSGVGFIVAVPSNKRTRLLYKKGRLRWLEVIGFNPDQAFKYMKAAERISRRWDHRVAKFVVDNFTIDPFVIDEILESTLPRNACLANGIYTTLNHGKVLAACNILKNLTRL